MNEKIIVIVKGLLVVGVIVGGVIVGGVIVGVMLWLIERHEKERERIFVDCLMRTSTWEDQNGQPVNGEWELCWKAAKKHEWYLSDTAYEAVK